MSSGVRHIPMLAFPNAQMLDVVGPLEVFAAANAIRSVEGAAPLYTIGIVGPAAGSFETASGLPLTATAGIERLHDRSEENTSELQSIMRISYAVFCLTTNKYTNNILYVIKSTTLHLMIT